jgi:SAM-dependent methyltransferase
MEHESMVHALDEIRRVLKSNGVLIDLRPVEDNWQVQVSASTGEQVAGSLNDLPIGREDDAAAFQAMREVESRGWFIRKKEMEFPFFYYFDTPSELKEFLDNEWDDFVKMEQGVFEQASSLWIAAGADAQLRIQVKMLITRWEKT